ncbi:hypothetical protein HMPREF1385_02676 [Staphylococcus epidermidis NIH051475]|nr:hypothetical protein HMPREF1385_02676 [Staphylococcus epidermidis NIH051475]
MLYEHNMLKNLMKYKELKQWLRILQTMQMDLIIIVSSLNQYVCHAHRYNHLLKLLEQLLEKLELTALLNHIIQSRAV